MDDRQLLEAAAKAAGIDLADARWHEDMGAFVFMTPRTPNWNPLRNDGDALRLAVKIGMEFAADDEATHCAFAYARVRGAGDSHIFEPVVDDPCKAMRRAIVRAAAALTSQEPQ